MACFQAASCAALLLSLKSVRGAAQAVRALHKPQPPRQAAPIDLTGNWVSVVTEDSRWRMPIPKKGNYSTVPLNPERSKVAHALDAARLASDGFKPYGSAAIKAVPGWLHILWDNHVALRIDLDAGQQTRLLHFNNALMPLGDGRWQRYSVAEWERIKQPGGLGTSLQQRTKAHGALKALTTEHASGISAQQWMCLIARTRQ